MAALNLNQLVPLARGQGGNFSSAQAAAFGLDVRSLRRAETSGRIERVFPQVRRFVGFEPTYSSWVWAGLLQAGPDAVASHDSVLRLHEIEGAAKTLAFTIGPRTNRPCNGITVHRFADLASSHRTVTNGIPSTTVARAIVDAGSVYRPARLAHLLDHATMIRRVVTITQVGRVLLEVDHRGRFGVGQVATLLDERSPGKVAPRSGLERHLDAVLAQTHLVSPSREHPLPSDGGFGGFVDRVFVDALLIVEADGRRWHSRMRDMARDRARDREASRLGWLTVRFLDEELAADPTGVVAQIAEIHDARLRQLRQAV